VRLDFMPFRGLSALDDWPDHATVCRFLNALVEAGSDGVILDEVDRQLTERGLKVKGGRMSVVDATVVESAARPGNPGGRVAVDRAEERTDGTDGAGSIGRVSADPDARWPRGAGRRTSAARRSGARTATDMWSASSSGPRTRGNRRISAAWPGVHGEACPCRQGVSGAANREMLAARGKRSGIMFRAARDHPLGPWRKVFNRLISRLRWIVGQCFRTFKRLFDGARAKVHDPEEGRGGCHQQGDGHEPAQGANRSESQPVRGTGVPGDRAPGPKHRSSGRKSPETGRKSLPVGGNAEFTIIAGDSAVFYNSLKLHSRP